MQLGRIGGMFPTLVGSPSNDISNNNNNNNNDDDDNDENWRIV